MMDFLIFQPDGSATVDLSKIDRAQAAAITELRIDERTVGTGKGARKVRSYKIKLADKGASLERLGKHLKLFVPGTADVVF